MTTILFLFLGQCVFAGVVIFVLKGLLDKELIRAAIEKFESCKISPDIKEIAIFSASTISDEFKYNLESIRKRKFADVNLKFQENTELKGGVVIALGEELLDFSLASRLENFWS